MLGIPALKEWQEIESIPGLQMSTSSFDRILFNLGGVRYDPEANLKTGKEGS